MAGIDRTAFSGLSIIPYVGSEAVDTSAADHVPAKDGFFRGLIVTATGDVKIDLIDKSSVTIPVVVAAGHHFELSGYMVTKVYKTGTTATVAYGLY